MDFSSTAPRGAPLPAQYYDMPSTAEFESEMGPVERWQRWFQDPLKSKAAGPEAVDYVSAKVVKSVNERLDQIGSRERRLTLRDIDRRSVWHKLNERLLQEQASENIMFPSLGDCGNEDAVQQHLHETVYVPVFNELYQETLAAYVGRGAYNRTAFYNPEPINLGPGGLTVAEYVTTPQTNDCNSDFFTPRVHVPGLGL